MAEPLDESAIENDPSVIYILDGDYRLCRCNAAWDRFALANSGESLLRDSVAGRSIFEYISGAVADHYRQVFERSLKSGGIWQQEYECSSPSIQRRFSMRIYPIRGELMIVNSLIVEDRHPAVAFPPIETRYRNSDGLIVMCANCRRAKVAETEEQWDWVPGFVEKRPFRVSHGLCSPCYEYYHSIIPT